MSELIVGITVGLCVAQLIAVIVIHRQLYAKKVGVTKELQDMLQAVSESHNSLTTTVAEVDRKASETKLRLEMSENLRSQLTKPIGPRPNV
jgi:hypothetical protein